MKRAFPQKVSPVAYPSLDSSGLSNLTVGQQFKRVLPGANRRARTSAAMIGLALSMGASSLLLPRQDDGAAAAEPKAAESTVTGLPPAFQPETPTPVVEVNTTPASATQGEYVVREGQTLWHIAQLHNASVETLALFNNIDPDAILRVGQVLRVPTVEVSAIGGTYSPNRRFASHEVVSVSEPISARADVEFSPTASLAPLQEDKNAEADAVEQLKAEQDEALNRLRQKRNALRNSLAELRSEEFGVAAVGEAELELADVEPVESEVLDGTPEQAEVAIAPALPVLDEPQAANPAEVLEIEPVATPPAAITETEAVVNEPQVAAIAPVAELPESSVSHQVKPGETLGSIASAYNVSRQTLVSVNGLANPDQLQVDQPLVIPVSPSDPEASQDTTVVLDPELTNAAGSTVVASPELQTTLMQNNVAPDSKLADVYQVDSGDTVVEIAYAHGISLEALVDTNQLQDPSKIWPGQVLKIPGSNPVNEAIAPQSSSSVEVASAQLSAETVAPSLQHLSTEVVVPTIPSVPTPELVAGIGGASVSPVPSEGSVAISTVVTDTEVASEEALAETQVSVVPSVLENSESPRDIHSEAFPNSYVAGLMAEISDLRDRYRSEALENQVEAEEATIIATAPNTEQPIANLQSTSSQAVNPEFNSDRYGETLQDEVRRLREERQVQQTPAEPSVVASAPSPAQRDTQEPLVATAPLGSESYEPLMQPITGRMVSPDLPPLSGADAYLPEGEPVFNGYRWPARGTLTSGYGWRWGRMHRGIDIGAPTGTPVFAAAPGVVQFSGWNSGGYGNMVEIRHPDGSMTRYAHHSRNLVQSGQQVNEGQQIAQVGSTGYSTGPHLHFEVHLPSQGTVDPIAYLPSR